MGLFGGTKTNNDKRFLPYLIEGEEVEAVYRLILDEICFTNKRVIFFDKNTLSTKKERVSIPYHSIHYFALEDEGLFDRDIEVTLATSSKNFTLKFSKGCDLTSLEKVLTTYICR